MATAHDNPDVPRFETDFLRILNNRGEQGRSKPRKRGFVVLARGATSLKGLQELCFKQKYNHCFTARYRLHANAAVGTLLKAFMWDINEINRGSDDKQIKGELLPSIDSWKKVFERSLDISEEELFRSIEPQAREFGVKIETVEDLRALEDPTDDFEPQGYLTREQVFMLFALLAKGEFLDTGKRMVIFAELNEQAGNNSDWEVARQLFNMLPERVGLVLSGAPGEFTLPTDDPHFLEITVPAETVNGSEPNVPVAYELKQASFIHDVPASQDELGVTAFATALARFILHKQTKAPLTIGIHGPWGKGKSSFMQLVDSALVNLVEANSKAAADGPAPAQTWTDMVAAMLREESEIQRLGDKQEQLNEEEKEALGKRIADFEKNKKAEVAFWKQMQKNAEPEVISAWFNAWQFEDAKQIWAGLASQISERMEASLPWRHQQLLRLKYAWENRKAELLLNILLPFAVICLVAGLFSLGAFRQVVLPEKLEGDFAGLLRLLLPAGSALLTIWFVSSKFLKVAEPISERVLTYVTLPNYRDQMGFQHKVQADLRFVYQFLEAHRPAVRMVVYIDDLDRCSEGKIMEILQAVNLILANSRFFVFVGMDTEMIYRAIRSHYQNNVPDRFPENYLRKILQISLHLPKTSQPERRAYLNSLFSWKARFGLAQRFPSVTTEKKTVIDKSPVTPSDQSLPYDLGQVLAIVPTRKEWVEDTADELEAFHDYATFLGDNPRGMKRLVNLHRLIKIMVAKPGEQWSKDYQRKLVKWLVFCDVWPNLVDDIFGQMKSRNALAEQLSGVESKEDERAVLVAELKEMDSRNCLGELVTRLEVFNDQLPYLEQLKNFDALKAADVLTFGDIATFGGTAYVSQLVVESPEIRPVVSNSTAKPNA